MVHVSYFHFHFHTVGQLHKPSKIMGGWSLKFSKYPTGAAQCESNFVKYGLSNVTFEGDRLSLDNSYISYIVPWHDINTSSFYRRTLQ